MLEDYRNAVNCLQAASTALTTAGLHQTAEYVQDLVDVHKKKLVNYDYLIEYDRKHNLERSLFN